MNLTQVELPVVGVYYFEVAACGNQRGGHQAPGFVERLGIPARQAQLVICLGWAGPVYLPGAVSRLETLAGLQEAGVSRCPAKNSIWMAPEKQHGRHI